MGKCLWPHGAFVLLALLASAGSTPSWELAIVGLFLELLALSTIVLPLTLKLRNAWRDAAGILLGVLVLWQTATAGLHVAPPLLLPSPGEVLRMLITERHEMYRSIWHSLALLAWGFSLALAVAVPMGIFVGWHLRLFRAAQPVVKVFGPLPPGVFIPYIIALLPSFRMAAVTVVFIGAFWPLFANAMQGVRLVPVQHIDVARTLNLGTVALLRRVVLPAAMPSLCNGVSVALVFAFVLMTSAEFIGASGGISAGLGYYVMYSDQIQDHRRMLAGIIVLGMLVALIVFLVNRIEKRLLAWRE